MKQYLIGCVLALCLSTNTYAQSNYALRFDGIDDSIFVGYSSVLDITGDISICAWIKSDSSQLGGIVTNYDPISPDNGYELCFGSYNGTGDGLFFEFASEDIRDRFTTDSLFDDGQWHFVSAVLTPDGVSRGKIYVDAVEQSGAYTFNPVPSIGVTPDYPFLIGVDYLQSYFEGVIDELRIWNVARTVAEIQADMYHELTGDEPGLVGYWTFNEGQGDTAYDYSGNGNDGIIHGAEWVISAAPQHIKDDPTWHVPTAYTLHQNYPNPFNMVSTIRYDLPQSGNVSLIVYDLSGREVTRLVNGHMEPGYHEVRWNGQNYASGIYIARLVTPEYSKSIKMLLLK